MSNRSEIVEFVFQDGRKLRLPMLLSEVRNLYLGRPVLIEGETFSVSSGGTRDENDDTLIIKVEKQMNSGQRP